MITIETIPVEAFHQSLRLVQPLDFPERWRRLALTEWTMDADDYILRYVFRHLKPRRHLEFGTWQGDGVLRCVEECDATVWTINVLEGEVLKDGQWAYATSDDGAQPRPSEWAETLQTERLWVRTDAYGRIGRTYLDAGWGRRVCQIYADSRQWDTRNYPQGFFDTVFVDGGHADDVVANDTRLAMELVKPGGLVMWHDFCPIPEVTAACESTRDVVGYVASHSEMLSRAFARLFWVEPSWLLFGVRATEDPR
jgi:hypothetical protein